VQSGAVDAYFDFPAHPEATAVRVYGTDKGIFENGKYGAVAQAMLARAVERKIASPQLSTLAAGRAQIDTVTYEGSRESGGLGTVVPPLIFLVIFYGLIVLLAGQMLNSTLEEKENRVTEMILTTLKPTTLIAGKVIALFAIGLLQMIVFISPIVIGRLFFPGALSLSAVDLPPLVFDPVRMTVGFLILVGGFALFTTTLVAIGAVMPTAKEAGNFMGVMMALIFVPFYAVALVVSDPHAVIVQIFTYFPFSAPVTALLRNGFGSLNLLEAGIVIAILFGGAAVMLRLAVRLFQYGSISYTSKVNLRTALRAGSRRAGSDAAPTTPAG
jgi:ABC-2 type transport system permease protein